MSQVDPSSPIQLETVPEEDRLWLQEQIKRYRDLLAYLREH
jgi:hypothetical protein